MRNVRIICEYDGTSYHGWQIQPNGISIQEVLEEKTGIITQEKIRLTASGRTDAGVHALNQVVNFRTKSALRCENLLKGINSLLPEDIVVKDLRDTEEDFHARYSAKSKVYTYRIFNNPVRTALYRNYSWHVRAPLDADAMGEAATLLKGRHDFSSFCAAGCDSENHIRTVIDTSVGVKDDMISFTVEANGFLRYMVRNIVGLLVDVGKGIITPAGFEEIMGARDRTQAGITAPPQGLFLREVRY
ncbi:MAG: tRNA pseudouridine(38-40) synthase TruA [Deltaproteobacteria bacterium]|nr:tRNA pseudouridine(38-40) synthase TruA [Deltaproteobacteria bacterium]MBW2594758.1 tRNA pseudouridine(38-40) synthase TruA [Deltaproteobacteria bacterium]